MELTSRQLETLNVIDLITKVEGRGPSFQEVADELGVTKRAAAKLLEALREKGWVEWDAYRSIRRVNPVVLQRIAELEARLAEIGDIMKQGDKDV